MNGFPPAFIAAVALLGYGLGSIPFGLLLTRLAGLGDIRRIGSGNIGATNVLRTGKKGLAAATLALDAGKGAAAALFAAWWLHGDPGAHDWAALAGFAAVVGHCYPVWLGFRGGKGVATGLAVIAVIDWPAGLAAALAWLVVAWAARISSLSALVAFLVAAVVGDYADPSWAGVAPGAIAAIVYLRHAANIRRLLHGEEPRIGAKTPDTA